MCQCYFQSLFLECRVQEQRQSRSYWCGHVLPQNIHFPSMCQLWLSALNNSLFFIEIHLWICLLVCQNLNSLNLSDPFIIQHIIQYRKCFQQKLSKEDLLCFCFICASLIELYGFSLEINTIWGMRSLITTQPKELLESLALLITAEQQLSNNKYLLSSFT